MVVVDRVEVLSVVLVVVGVEVKGVVVVEAKILRKKRELTNINFQIFKKIVFKKKS